MKKVKNLRMVLLTAVLLGLLMVMMVVKACYPAVILPMLNIPNMVLISVVVLLLENRLDPLAESNWWCNLLLAVLAFGLLPLMAGVTSLLDFWKVGLVGGGVFTLTALAMDSVRERLASGTKTGGALLVTALGIYLAAQCFSGILL